VEGGAVYVGSLDGKAYALNADSGAKLWEFAADDWVFAAPLATSETVYIASMDRRLYALNPRDGSKRWQLEPGGRLQATPVLAGSNVIVASDSGVVAAVGPDGAARWSVTLPSHVPGPLTLSAGTLFLSDKNSQNLVAIDAANGQRRWTRDHAWASKS
jgi:outer membrane protein assembly factor BamB